jgi:hypothetical protein
MNGKVVCAACAVLVLASFGAVADAAGPTNVADLATALQGQRDVCAKMAADAKDAYSLAQYQSGLDRQTAALKAKMDARVYGVGHGGRETTEYYVQQMQNADSAQDAKDKAISDKFEASTKQVAQCVSSAEQQGKATYVAFKKHHTSKSARSEAEALMTAWLANVGEISTSSPNGSDDSYADWKTAKAHAEVSSL